ncbi:unnamed protein product [Rotaria magnacalcarata]|nr:unnamed protein product [Rotaria magnacalcarata]
MSLYPIVDDSYTDPDVPSWDSFDDILVNNAFVINGNSGGCVVKSPMFWTCIVLGICLIILVIMGILFHFPESKSYFARLRFIFQQADLIGEGKMWIGGLVSFAIMILIIYAFWFSLAFIKLYPIEESEDANFACDTGLRNSKFTSTLRLLTSKKSDTDAPMFQMLDNQQLQLTVDFIQSGFICDDIHVHEYVGFQWIHLKPNRCFRQEDNATSTISFDLHDHQMGLTFDLAGNCYIGGARLCLTASKTLSHDTFYTTQPVIFCQIISNTNETLGKDVRVTIELTKAINRTESLDEGGQRTYSGVWIPRLIAEGTSDKMIYDEYGSSIRYLTIVHRMQVTLKEASFFIMNIQEPITRKGEAIFKDILFSSMCLEFCAITFLLFKLAILPLLKRLHRKLHQYDFCKKRFKQQNLDETTLAKI